MKRWNFVERDGNYGDRSHRHRDADAPSEVRALTMTKLGQSDVRRCAALALAVIKFQVFSV